MWHCTPTTPCQQIQLLTQTVLPHFIESNFLCWNKKVGMTSVPGVLRCRTHPFVNEDDDF